MGTKRKKATPGRAQFGQPTSIKDAALVVLREAGKPLTVSEITAGIIAGKLYSFNTPTPGNMVQKAIRRTCTGVDIAQSTTGSPLFVAVDVNGKPHYTPAKGGK